KETPAEVQHNDQVDQEKIAALALQKAQEQQKIEQEEKQRARQVLLDEAEKENKIKEEKRKELAEITKQRIAAEKAVKLENEKLKQLSDFNQRNTEKQEAQPEAEHEAPKAMTGANGQDNDLAARYSAAIQAAVKGSWNRPDSAQAGLRCSLNIVQIPGGDVISVTVGSPCNADPATRNSIEQAVMKAAPLPYQGFEKVFQRSATLNFRYDG
ncbi:MAG TPA: cell envelope integrity protein TolA, partial [Dokdonella sp.]